MELPHYETRSIFTMNVYMMNLVAKVTDGKHKNISYIHIIMEKIPEKN